MLSPGIIIGEKYRLEEPIGQGGMATVWRATHTTLDRPVAVKFLEAVGTHAQQLAARFLREAKLAAGLRHRHVVDIVDFGVTDTGQPFMVMELLEGKSLADRYTLGPPVTDWALLEIVSMTLGGLAAVHDAGILHRDIKPENIFLVEDADGTYPKLIDFGVSKGFSEGDRITRTGAVVGTPEYMSPEQARGLREIGPPSDLWAVGVVLYEGLTGHCPFESENPGDVLIAIATEDLTPLADWRPDLPEMVVDLVHKALAKKPEDRFQDAREMRDALHAVMQADVHIDGGPEGRAAFGPAPGSGLIRVVTVPVPPPSLPSSPEIVLPLSPRLPRESRDGTKDPTPITADQEIEALDVARPAALAPARSRWPVLTGAVVVLLGVAAGAFFALDGRAWLARSGLLGEGDRDGAAAGQLRPGLDVAALGVPTEPGSGSTTAVAFDPPPTDGVDAPDATTIDVPSPPDPPADVAEIVVDEPPPVEAEAAPAPAPRGRRAPRRRLRRPAAP